VNVGRNISGIEEDQLTPESLNIHATQKWKKYSKSKTAEHSWTEDHSIQWNTAEITYKEENNHSKTESWYSSKQQTRLSVNQS
jgi:hypothetical protein